MTDPVPGGPGPPTTQAGKTPRFTADTNEDHPYAESVRVACLGSLLSRTVMIPNSGEPSVISMQFSSPLLWVDFLHRTVLERGGRFHRYSSK